MSSEYPKYSKSPSYATQMKQLTKVLPEYMQTTASQILPYEQALFQAQQQVLPRYTEAQMQLAREYAPAAAELQDAIDAAHAARVSQADVALARGAGGDMVSAVDAINRQLNPEFYATRELGARSLGDLIKSYDLSKGVSGGESANVERNLNRMNEGLGQTRVPTSTGAITNALAFDDRLQAKKSALSGVLSMLPNQLASFQSGINPMLATTRSTSPANTNFIGYSTPQIGSFGQQAAAQQSSQINQNRANEMQAALGRYTIEMQKNKDVFDVMDKSPILGLLS